MKKELIRRKDPEDTSAKKFIYDLFNGLHSENPISKKIFESYTHKIIPRLGKIIAKDDQSYTYLAESISSYYSPEEVSELFYDNKFSNVRYEVLPGEIVTIHIGYKS